MPRNEEIARQLVACINTHDADAVAALLTPEHRFIDSLGNVVVGRQAMREGWRQYFRMVPDYRIEVERVFAAGDEVVLLGSARGTYAPQGVRHLSNAWSTPAALRAQIADGQVAAWQVYADNDPIRRLIAAASA